MTDFHKRDSDMKKPNEDSAESRITKKLFVEPEIKEFDDLEKQIKSPIVGTFTP
jgi:hypothetical protein